MAYRAIIADDERELRVYLRALLSEVWPDLVICGEAGNGREVLDLVESVHPEVAFLDIKMPGLSGMEAARRIAGVCRVVFVTAYDQYAVEAFEREAVDYLLKPVSKERLTRTVRRLQDQLAASNEPPPGLAEAVEQVLCKAVGRTGEDVSQMDQDPADGEHPSYPRRRGRLLQGRRQVYGGCGEGGGVPHQEEYKRNWPVSSILTGSGKSTGLS